MRRVVHYPILIWALVGLSACEFNRDRKPSVLVIAVEGLGVEALSCDSEQGEPVEGLRAFCEESVRFTHAYAPSTMSQASMASLLTGLYPLDHGVHHNGPEFLSSRFTTLAEAALAKRYRTLFVSGGAPIWRKSGLAQGFEVFDDQVEISVGTYYRPVDEVFRLATHWMEHESYGLPFVSVLFLADLQFPQVATRTNEGEVRERSPAAQLEEVTEALGGLVKWLKARRLWNSTNIALVGLNSFTTRENDPQPAPLALRSRSAQVSLFIKPARKERDNVIQWAVDRNISLVDLGATMFQWLGADAPAGSLTELQAQSLVSVLQQPEPNWDEDRLILSETAWPDWLEGSGVRWAVRQNQFLYINDLKPLIFNTLTDRMESMPLKTNDPLWTSLNGEVLGLMQKVRIPPFKGMGPHWLEQIDVARELWRENQNSRAPKGDEPWSRWYLRRALADRDWKTVKRLAQAVNDPIGVYIAAHNSGEVATLPRQACLRLMLATKGDKRAYQSDCGDEKVLALHAWQTARGDEERATAQDRFVRAYRQMVIDQDLGRLNFLNDLRWDVDRLVPEGPQLIDYLLTTRELEPFAKKSLSLLNAKDVRF